MFVKLQFGGSAGRKSPPCPWCAPYVPSGLIFKSSRFCLQSEFTFFVSTSEQIETLTLYNIKLFTGIIEINSVYCAVLPGSINTTHYDLPLHAGVWVRSQVSSCEI